MKWHDWVFVVWGGIAVLVCAYLGWIAFIAHCVRMAYKMGLLP